MSLRHFFCSLIDEELHDFEISAPAIHEDRFAVLVLAFDVCSLIDEEFHDFEISPPAAAMRTVSPLVLAFTSAPLSMRSSHDFEISRPGSVHEDRSPFCPRHSRRPLIDEELHGFEISPAAAFMRTVCSSVLGIHVPTLCQQGFDLLQQNRSRLPAAVVHSTEGCGPRFRVRATE